MTVELRAVCDACGCGGPTLDAEAESTDAAIAASLLVDGPPPYRHVHEACRDDLARGVDPALVYGLPGMAS